MDNHPSLLRQFPGVRYLAIYNTIEAVLAFGVIILGVVFPLFIRKSLPQPDASTFFWIAIGFLSFIVCLGLWKFQAWSLWSALFKEILLLIGCVVFLVLPAYTHPSFGTQLIISIIVVLYLTLNKKIRQIYLQSTNRS